MTSRETGAARLDPYLPWPGNPRRFYAIAMPNGDKRAGIEGQLVFVKEQRAGTKEPGSVLTRAEAEQLLRELQRALDTFGVAEALARDVAAPVGDRPRAYTGPWPIRGPSLADVGFLAATEAA